MPLFRSLAAQAGQVSGRGPDGTHWPADTPTYTTTATKTATSATLDAALGTAVSGDVIEVTGTISGDVILNGGSQTWAQNVLIRPPIGERGKAARFYIRAHRVTVAGFTLSGAEIGWAGNESTQLARRSHFARCVLTTNSQLTVTNADDACLYEIVAPDYGTSADRVQVRNYGTGMDAYRNGIVGCYLKGKWRAVGATDHNDTVQFWGEGGGTLFDPYIEDSVVFTSGDKAVQTGSGRVERMVWRNSWLNEPSTATEQPPTGFEKYGAHVCNGGGFSPSAFGCTVLGSVGNSAEAWVEVRDTLYGSWGPISSTSGNTTGVTSPTVNPPPSLPDLDTIWGT